MLFKASNPAALVPSPLWPSSRVTPRIFSPLSLDLLFFLSKNDPSLLNFHAPGLSIDPSIHINCCHCPRAVFLFFSWRCAKLPLSASFFPRPFSGKCQIFHSLFNHPRIHSFLIRWGWDGFSGIRSSFLPPSLLTFAIFFFFFFKLSLQRLQFSETAASPHAECDRYDQTFFFERIFDKISSPLSPSLLLVSLLLLSDRPLAC